VEVLCTPAMDMSVYMPEGERQIMSGPPAP
jgi:hypothetical protein